MLPFDAVTLSTERLTLRSWTEADVPALFEIYSHPEVMRYWSSPPLGELSEASQKLIGIQEGYRTRTGLQLAIERRSDNIVVGACALHDFHFPSRRAEIGYALGRPFWGVGYMQEALTALIKYSFETLDLNRLEADIDPRNQASAKTLEKLGFQKEGHLHERWIVSGEISDTWFYGLLQRNWRERSGAV